MTRGLWHQLVIPFPAAGRSFPCRVGLFNGIAVQFALETMLKAVIYFQYSLLMNEGFTEEQAYAGSASTGAILSNDPCYIDANYYQTVMYPTCSEAEMVAYLTSCGYSPQRAALVADDIFNAKG